MASLEEVGPVPEEHRRYSADYQKGYKTGLSNLKYYMPEKGDDEIVDKEFIAECVKTVRQNRRGFPRDPYEQAFDDGFNMALYRAQHKFD